MRPRKYKHWTKKDEQKIIDFMKTQGLQILADELNVTYMSLTGKINMMRRQGRFNGINAEI